MIFQFEKLFDVSSISLTKIHKKAYSFIHWTGNPSMRESESVSSLLMIPFNVFIDVPEGSSCPPPVDASLEECE